MNFTKANVFSDQLVKEIQASAITIALENISHTGTSLDITFKAQLSEAEIAILNTLVTNHVPVPVTFVPIVKLDVPKTSTGLQKVSLNEPEGQSATIVTHDFSRPETWYMMSVQVPTEAMVLDEGLTYKFQNDRKNIIDLTHGKIYDEDNIMIQSNNLYALKVYVDGVLKVEDEQYQTYIDQPLNELYRDYYVDYSTGKVTFRSDPAGAVTASYSYATTSYYRVRPKITKTLGIKAAEVQFSVDTKLRGPFVFEPWFVDHPTYGTMQVPLSFGQQIVYKNAKDFISACNQGQGTIEPWGELTKKISVFPFDYARPKPTKYSEYIEIRVYCKNHLPVDAEYATATFYVTIDPTVTT